MLVTKSLSKSFLKVPVFKNVTFSLAFGETLQITGPNGVGKTTLLKCLAGYLNSCFEQLTLNNQALRNEDCAFVSADDRCFFPKLSLKENYEFFQKFHGKFVDPSPWIDFLGIERFWEKPYQSCSTGIRKRMAFLRGVGKQSPILLLDEPFANLDPVFQNQLIDRLFSENFKANRIIIFSSNNPINQTGLKNFKLGELK